MHSIYLDHAATTPVHPEVKTAMLPFYEENFGNPSSTHAFGREARYALDQAREDMAHDLGCSESELIFTSGGTESNNLALFGTVMRHPRGSHIITTTIEHHAVLKPCEQLKKWGYEVTFLPVDSYGRVDVAQIEKAIRKNTVIISVMYGNNEVGTLQPIDQIGQLCRAHGILLHVDAVQALGVEEMRLSERPIDLASFSAHKIQGPKGIGALYVRRGVELDTWMHGGSQESRRRGGTEHVAGTVGMAKALRLITTARKDRNDHLQLMKTTLLNQLTERLGESGYRVNGDLAHSLPHIVNLSFPGVDFESLLMNLDLIGIAASSGSACTSGSLEVSHVLSAMHVSSEVAHSSVRFSFGSEHTIETIAWSAQQIARQVERLRGIEIGG